MVEEGAAADTPSTGPAEAEGGQSQAPPQRSPTSPAPPSGGQRQELSEVLAKRRSRTETRGSSWQSSPKASKADAGHLELSRRLGVELGSLSLSQWRKDLQQDEQEDLRQEALRALLDKRGQAPRHLASWKDSAELAQLESALRDLSQRRHTLDAKQAALGDKRNGLQHRQEALAAQEAASQGLAGSSLRAQFQLGTINIGVVGSSGVGKSKLINRLRGLKPGDRDAAPVGVTTTTREASVYSFPAEPRVRLWDFPGPTGGSVDDYIKSNDLVSFDAMVIVSKTRYTETEKELERALRLHNVPFCLVRTHVDVDIHNNKVDNGKSATDTLEEIRSQTVGAWTAGTEAPPQLFLVSLREEDAKTYDFCQLMEFLFPGLGQAAEEEPWLLPAAPVTYSHLVTKLQGDYTDRTCQYTVVGLSVHIAHGDVGGTLTLTEQDGKVWWKDTWSIDLDSFKDDNRELRWAPRDLSVAKTFVWWRC